MKSRLMMAVLSVLVVAMAAPYALAQPGAPMPGSVKEKEVQQAAKFAVSAQQQAMKTAGKTDKLTLVKVVSVKKQVVAGMNYIMTLQVKQGTKVRTADATVWEQAWQKTPYKLTAWKFTDEKEAAPAKPDAGQAPAPPTKKSKPSRGKKPVGESKPAT